MPEVRGRFLERISRTHNVESFRFEPDDRVEFLPGQFLQVLFDEQDRGNKDLNKYLSFSCAPGKEYIEVTKKISESDFSKKLMALKAGDKVLFKAPMGHCVLRDEEKKIGFLIGGIGITPVISMLEYIFEKDLPTDACLLYSNWTAQDVAFRQELDSWSQKNKNIRVVHTLMECKPEDTACFSAGVINREFIQKNMPDFGERILFVFGPPGMVKAMQDLCQQIGCNKEKIRAENFLGY
jgi:glycine betaine catabolism B